MRLVASNSSFSSRASAPVSQPRYTRHELRSFICVFEHKSNFGAYLAEDMRTSDDRASNPCSYLPFAEVASAAPAYKLSRPYAFYNYPETNVAVLRFCDVPILQLQ
jgi:hypothetical protein